MSGEPVLPRWLHAVVLGSLFGVIVLVGVLMAKEAGRPVQIEQRMVADLGVVDRCETCHDAADHPAPWLDAHPVERFACTPCHGGQGLAVLADDAHDAGPDWEHPLFDAAEREAACGGCHEEPVLEGAPRLTRGRALLAERGCAGCHAIPGLDLPQLAPQLDGLRDKVPPAWVRAWLTDPAPLNPAHRMPRFALTEGERDALVAFLFSLDGPAVGPAPTGGDPERGRLAVAQRRCATCHRINDRGGETGPDLGLAGAKLRPAWLAAMLTDTHRLRPTTRMPGFRLSAEEAADIAAYAAEQWVPDADAPWQGQPDDVKPALVAEGRAIFVDRGCGGCHAAGDVPRVATAMALDDLGRRHVADLPRAGTAPTRDLPSWIATKVLVPTAFDTPTGAPAKMPAFTGLSLDDALDVGIALAALRREGVSGAWKVHAPAVTIAAPAGEVGGIVDRFRCLVCHQLGGQGGTIAGVALDGEGSRVRRDWLVAFLQQPVTIRMDQGARMPVLGIDAEQAAKLADWIGSSLADPRIPEGATVGDAVAGEAAYRAGGCSGCHVVRGEGTMKGPTLDGAGARLDVDYVVALLVDGAVVPANRHPAGGLPAAEARDIAAWIESL